MTLAAENMQRPEPPYWPAVGCLSKECRTCAVFYPLKQPDLGFQSMVKQSNSKSQAKVVLLQGLC